MRNCCRLVIDRAAVAIKYPLGWGGRIHVKEGVMCNLRSLDRCPGIYSIETISDVLTIIDKYKAESEDNNGA